MKRGKTVNRIEHQTDFDKNWKHDVSGKTTKLAKFIKQNSKEEKTNYPDEVYCVLKLESIRAITTDDVCLICSKASLFSFELSCLAEILCLI